MNSTNSKPLRITLAVVCGLICLPLDGLSSDSSPYIVASKEDMPLEQRLALVNANKGALPSDDITIARFRYLLEKAAAKTGDTQKEIADDVCRGQALVREDGKNMTVLEFMEAVNRFLAVPGLPKMKYREAAVRVSMAISQQ